MFLPGVTRLIVSFSYTSKVLEFEEFDNFDRGRIGKFMKLDSCSRLLDWPRVC